METQTTYGLVKVFMDPKFYFGLLTIVMYAKDKFNMPTYNRDAMGPFAQLSPQLLTVDSRYRKGRMIYLVSIVFLYITLCLVGPTTLQALNVPFAKAADDAFPVAAAAFLISTAAASDSSWLGRIELFIRQYAHKAAYIPTAVSDLAFSLRKVDIKQWLMTADATVDQKELGARQEAIKEFAGEFAFNKIKEDPGQEGAIASWIRANILFFVLQEIFGRRKALPNSKFDYLAELPENRENFDRIQTDRAAIAGKLPQNADADKAIQAIYPEVQRLVKVTSLTLAVLLSQAARSSSYINVHLDQFGFRGGYLRDRSDHFVYTTLVNVFILLAALINIAMLAAASVLFYPPDKLRALLGAIALIAGTGILSYVTLFAVLDYLRDKLLDSMDWQEGLEGYVRIVIPCGMIAAIGCTILVILGFSVAGLNGYVSFIGIFQNLLVQVIVAALGASFGVRYLRQAARLRSNQASLRSPAFLKLPILHGFLAAALVGGLNYGVDQYNLAADIESRLSQISSLTDRLRDPGKLELSPTGFFSGKDPKHVSYLLDKVENATTIARAYMSNSRGLDPDSVRSTQAKAILDACQELQTYVVTPEGKSRFSNERCGLDVDVKARDKIDRAFVDLANELSELGRALGRYDYTTLIFSAGGAFVFAFIFGIGLTYWRVWWLNNEIDLPDGEIGKLEEQAKRAFGGDIRFSEFLIHPLMVVNNLTPLEAVRYEDYRGKLFTDVLKKDPEIERILRPQAPALNGAAGQPGDPKSAATAS